MAECKGARMRQTTKAASFYDKEKLAEKNPPRMVECKGARMRQTAMSRVFMIRKNSQKKIRHGWRNVKAHGCARRQKPRVFMK